MKNNNVLVIHEKDLQDSEQSVVGVASSVKDADILINEYYGKLKEISYNDIRDSNLEYTKVFEVLDHLNKPYKVEITLEWFNINEA